MIEAKTDKLHSAPQMPNFVVWNWMREALELSGTNLMIFAYVYSQSFDGVHYSTTSLSTMEKWFGITRQTISRNLERMPYVKKLTYVNPEVNNFKYNYYRVDMEEILKICMNKGTSIYDDFMLSYKNILLLKFPEDDKEIDDYFDTMLNWHKLSNATYTVDFKTITTIVDMLMNSSVPEEKSFRSIIETLSKNNISQGYISDSEVLKDTVSPTDASEPPPEISNTVEKPKVTGKFKATELFKPTKPKKESKQARLNRERAEMDAMTRDFVLTYADNNSELLDILDAYLDFRVTSFITPAQWSANLKLFRKVHKTVPEMISGATTALAAGYRKLAYENQQTIIADNYKFERNNLVKEFVANYGEGNADLESVLLKYSEEVADRKNVTPNQFSVLLKNLHKLCPTTEQKLESVTNAYASGWSALAYANRFNDCTTSSASNTVIDKDKKLSIIDKFFTDGFYYLTPEIKELLIQYITETKSGRNMSANRFSLSLDFLRLHCPLEEHKITAIKEAILKDTEYLCREDFNDTKQAKKAYNSLENRAYNMDRNRKQTAHRYYMEHPTDPRFVDFPDLPKIPGYAAS